MMLHTTHISSSNISIVDNVEGGGGDVVGDRVESGYGLGELIVFDIKIVGLTQGALASWWQKGSWRQD